MWKSIHSTSERDAGFRGASEAALLCTLYKAIWMSENSIDSMWSCRPILRFESLKEGLRRFVSGPANGSSWGMEKHSGLPPPHEP